MSGLNNMIGELVTSGYMATWHEQLIYLHDSQGKRWAEIEPFTLPMTVTVDNKTYTADNTRGILQQLGEVE